MLWHPSVSVVPSCTSPFNPVIHKRCQAALVVSAAIQRRERESALIHLMAALLGSILPVFNRFRCTSNPPQPPSFLIISDFKIAPDWWYWLSQTKLSIPVSGLVFWGRMFLLSACWEFKWTWQNQCVFESTSV